MSKVRNAVIIIVLCLIGAATYMKKSPSLNMPGNDQLKDAIAGHSNRVKPSAPKLNMRDGSDDSMRDAVAGHAAGTPAGRHGNTLDDVAPPPRGSGSGGFKHLTTNNPGSDIPVNPPSLSPSGPTQ